MPNDKSLPDSLTRREFTLQSALALLAGVIVTVDGCGGSSPAAPAPPTPVADVAGAVSANHGHAVTISSAQIAAANALSLSLQGTSSHPHTVDLSQAELRTLQSRQPVTKDSTNTAGHQHTVTFTPV